jgi:hypothetical protein
LSPGFKSQIAIVAEIRQGQTADPQSR